MRAERLFPAHCVVVCRTGVIHDPVRQTCIFDTEWSSGSKGGGRRLEEATGPSECAVDASEVKMELREVKRESGKATAETTEMRVELSEVKRQLRKAEEVAETMSRELHEVKALLKQLATAK